MQNSGAKVDSDTPRRSAKKWTKTEDSILRKASIITKNASVEALNWKHIALFHFGNKRTAEDCETRYKYLMDNGVSKV